MQMAAYRTLLFRSHRSHSHVREREKEKGRKRKRKRERERKRELRSTRHLRFSIYDLLSLSLSFAFSESANVFMYALVHVYRDRVRNYEHIEAKRGMKMHRLCVNASQRNSARDRGTILQLTKSFWPLYTNSRHILDATDRFPKRERSNLTANLV